MLKVNIFQANTHLYFNAFQYSATIDTAYLKPLDQKEHWLEMGSMGLFFTQLIFTSFKVSSRNTEKKVWNMLKVNNKDTRMKPLTSFWCFYC